MPRVCSCSLARSLTLSLTRNVSAALLTHSLMPSSGPQGGQSHGRGICILYAGLAPIFIVAMLWASRQGAGPASSHSFTLHQDSKIISPLTLAGSSCPKPSTINGAKYILPFPLQTQLSSEYVLESLNSIPDARKDIVFRNEQSLHKLDSLLCLDCSPCVPSRIRSAPCYIIGCSQHRN